MIDLEAIRILQLEWIERQLANERTDKLRAHQSFSDRQRQQLIDAELDREKAEEDFPEMLRMIEEKIIQHVKIGTTSYTHSFGWNVKDTYIIKMLLDVLPLHGYVCRLNEGKLEISW
jgi:hypothetical protein